MQLILTLRQWLQLQLSTYALTALEPARPSLFFGVVFISFTQDAELSVNTYVSRHGIRLYVRWPAEEGHMHHILPFWVSVGNLLLKSILVSCGEESKRERDLFVTSTKAWASLFCQVNTSGWLLIIDQKGHTNQSWPIRGQLAVNSLTLSQSQTCRAHPPHRVALLVHGLCPFLFV